MPTTVSKPRPSRLAKQTASPPKKKAGPGDGAPKYHRGNVLANRLGLQVARVLWADAAWRRRQRPPANAEAHALADAIERDGIVVVPDFLPHPQFRAVRGEFDAAYQAGQYHRGWPEDTDVCEDYLGIKEQDESFAATRAALQENQLLRAVAAAVVRRPAHLLPHISARSWRRAPRPGGDQRLTGAIYIHADVHYPTCKAWLYLNDIDQGNGAFVYCPGSHRITRARLAYEYEASLRVARSRRQQQCHTQVPYGLVRIPSPEQIAAMGLREESIGGRANTLVIANTQGFHRMGEFRDDRAREKIYIDFRNVESRLNRRQRAVAA